jgi:hypothetical protein
MRTFAAILSVVLLFGPDLAQGFEVFQDPGCTAPGTTELIPTNGSDVELRLCIQHPGTGSDPNLACSGVGSGDEFCGWDLRIVATDGATLVDFVPDDPNAVVFNLTPSELRGNGGNPILGQVGAHPVGTLTVKATSAPGTVQVTGNLYVTSALETASVEANTLAATDTCADKGGDSDGDTLCDDEDPCKTFANTLPLVISGFFGIPDECLCGDFDGDGFFSATDAAAINGCAAFTRFDCVPERDEVAEPLDGFYSATDADLVNRVAAFIDPAYALKCGRRPEGTCGGDTGVSCF